MPYPSSRLFRRLRHQNGRRERVQGGELASLPVSPVYEKEINRNGMSISDMYILKIILLSPLVASLYVRNRNFYNEPKHAMRPQSRSKFVNIAVCRGHDACDMRIRDGSVSSCL
ncbi:hypothetical protein EVAR_25963_1 [Eumeta japonica]|uniref:Uncharacterized protein n=1 Tax=Eumeta variegata TaxID=151549 RepID=A0A4C1V1E9_EUMVA|nr:hypothetical protein EVAR_25963_1 [Eumeta japonica]